MTRRDFINGMALAVVAGMSPRELLALQGNMGEIQQRFYPPSLQNLVGSDNESYMFAHALRDGESFDFSRLAVEESYDLVVVGAGISGLSAACLFHDRVGTNAKSLILDNHKDFGGHARRNEFHTNGGMILSYGGSESLQSPKSLYSKKVLSFLHSLGVDIPTLEKCFNIDFYPNMKLSRGVFFNKRDFGVNTIVSGDPRTIVDDAIPRDKSNARTFAEFIGDFPMPQSDREALIRFYTNPSDYLAGMSKSQKKDYLAKTSYKTFLLDKVKLSPLAVSFFDGMSDDFMALGIDMISCEIAMECAFPGFDNIGLKKESHAEFEEPYIHHFPDGNASIARLMVKKLIPSITAAAINPQDILLARFDYSKLDMPNAPCKIRLQSTAIHARNVNGGVEIVYGDHRSKRLKKVFAKKLIMASYNSMIPYIIPELNESQKQALSQCVKTSLIYTKVLLANWECFVNLGVHDIYAPKSFYVNTKLDYPVNMGAYKHPTNPKKPICLHMIGSPLRLNDESIRGESLDARTISRLTRHTLFDTPFSTLEKMTKEHLHAMLGSAGFKTKDILGITLNRWGHCYAYNYNSLYDDKKQSKKTIRTARKPLGNIAIANSDSDWEAFLHTAIEQSMRAIDELKV
ncbi:spermidine dehydrogenase [Helicobacter didelphidarum]|uniref:Spermidine dehydrogenase n=1 Tax=Helicobacter didelphidarum TaxID=2040648 RepID=A0A3D8IJ80_9HELI|nr:FAD/NAD(P)-binding protein [Helicobacter didelphidarum]RDU64631.1 spermidine dehydrogenase [Helicobacter didelphidarum]